MIPMAPLSGPKEDVTGSKVLNTIQVHFTTYKFENLT